MTNSPTPTKCSHPGCDERAEHRFTLRLKGGRIVRYCAEHWKARTAGKAAKAS